MNDWILDGAEITDINQLPEDAFGIIYKIVHKPTQMYYIGKKQLRSYRNKKLGVRAKAKLKEERRKKGIPGRTPSKKLVITESDWKTYYGSNDEVQKLIEEDGEDQFERIILRVTTSKKQQTYYEIYEQMKHDVLLDDNSFNENINSKFFWKDLE